MKIMRMLSGTVIVTLLAIFASCDELMGEGEALQPDEQKEFLENVAVELLKTAPAEDMERYATLLNSFNSEYLEDDEYDFSALEDFSEDAYDGSYTEEEREYVDVAKNEYVRESVINLAIVLSNHKGEFTFGRNSVVKDNSNYDGVKVNAQIGSKNYTAELKSSGKVTAANYNYQYYSSYESDGYWDEKNSEWVSRPGMFEVYDDKFNLTIDVPEKIEVALNEEGKPIAAITVNMTKNFTAAGLNPAVDNFNAKVVITFDNGYEIIVDKFSYDGSKGRAGGAVSFKKDGVTLVSSSAEADAQIINSLHSCEDGDHEYTTVEVKKAKNLKGEVDILGQVQVKATCSNAMDANESLDAYYDALSNWDDETGNEKTPDEATALRHLANFNAKIDCGVYYNGTSTRQAAVVFEMDKYFEEAYWDRNDDGVVNSADNYTYYDMIPVIVFGDGSRYTVEDYFTEEAFDKLMDEIDGFEDDYDDLLGSIEMFEENEPVENIRY